VGARVTGSGADDAERAGGRLMVRPASGGSSTGAFLRS
jgi:hypothetical protein